MVVGSRGLGGFLGLVLVSVAREVVEGCTVPVLVVNEPVEYASSQQPKDQ